MEREDYVTISQLSEIKNVHPRTIMRLLSEGFFEGAIQEIINGKATWLIPRSVALLWQPKPKGWQHKKEKE